MKRKGNLYNKLLDIDYILEVYSIIQKNTKNKKKIEKFEENLSSNIIDIQNKILNFKMEKYHMFKIYEPKERFILSLDLKDKIINHMVAYILIDVLEPSLIDSNIAVRKNKGNSYGIKLIKRYLSKLDDFYCLKCDMTKYFYNINHDILKDMLKKKIKDQKFLNIVYKIIDSTNQDYILEYCKNNNISYFKKEIGLSIGNMTSQILGIFYLNDLDHYIKEVLKIKYYIRYMDDLVIIHEDRNYLKYCLNKIKIYIKKYGLELNHKTMITKNQFIFLGYHFYTNKIKIISKNRRKIKKKLRLLKQYDGFKYNQVFVSYKGYFKVET